MPFSKKILPKLHKFLFRSYDEKISTLENKVAFQDGVIVNERIKNISLEKEKLAHFNLVKSIKKKPTMADLMRECLGVLPMDFTNVVDSPDAEETARMTPEQAAARSNDIGLPKDFLDTIKPDVRETYIAQLYQIWNMEVFTLMCDHYVNLQGNWTLRKAVDDMQVFAGRMSINGIYLIKNKVKAGHDEYKERSKPPEEFDEHELDEGFDISNLTNRKQ